MLEVYEEIYDTKNLTGYMFELCGKLKKTFRISNYNFEDNIVLHNNGTIFIYKRDTHIILAWNVVTLDFITYLPTEWEIDCTRNIIVNKEATLLVIWFNKCIYIYSINLHLMISFYNVGYNITKCYFLLFEGREFLFSTYEQNLFCLLDPYIFNGEYNEETEEKSEYPYIFINKETEKISEHPNIFTDEDTEETFTLKLDQPCIINYNTIFYIYENELKLRKFPEAWRNKLNKIRSNFVVKKY